LIVNVFNIYIILAFGFIRYAFGISVGQIGWKSARSLNNRNLTSSLTTLFWRSDIILLISFSGNHFSNRSCLSFDGYSFARETYLSKLELIKVSFQTLSIQDIHTCENNLFKYFCSFHQSENSLAISLIPISSLVIFFLENKDLVHFIHQF
jgi:hypothetical protein